MHTPYTDTNLIFDILNSHFLIKAENIYRRNQYNENPLSIFTGVHNPSTSEKKISNTPNKKACCLFDNRIKTIFRYGDKIYINIYRVTNQYLPDNIGKIPYKINSFLLAPRNKQEIMPNNQDQKTVTKIRCNSLAILNGCAPAERKYPDIITYIFTAIKHVKYMNLLVRNADE